VLQASTIGEPRIAAVSVFLHPTDRPTSYTGAIMVEFIGSGGRHHYEMALRHYEIDPGERPAGVTAAGLIVTSPGNYSVDIAMLAQVAGRRDPAQLSTTIDVRVDPPET
jgi:hypothetical protein